MTSYGEITIKNHKKYNKKIIFLIFNECDINDENAIEKLIVEYHKVMEENPGISSIIDARNVKSCSKTLAFSKAKTLKKYDTIARANLVSMAILLDNPVLKLLMDAVTKVHPFIIPTKIVKDNKSAMEFVVSQFN
jgi:Pyruvate/2-oxoacid:ferredoxin oxidoreductase gamma subunit